MIGLPHETLGEEVVAIIALKANAQTIDAEIMQQDIQQFLRDRLAKYKMPRKYFFVAEIPRNHLGKVYSEIHTYITPCLSFAFYTGEQENACARISFFK